MALSKQQLLDLIDASCTDQGTMEVSGPVLKELVENYIPVITLGVAIADLIPATATAEQVATTVNSVLVVLRANGIIAEA